MSRLALGTVQFGLNYGVANRTGQVPRAQAQEMLSIVRANQIDTLDTAIAYGESEKILGELGVNDVKLVTKLPELPKACADVQTWITTQFETSLARLKTHSVYGLLLHRSDLLTKESTVASSVWNSLLGLKSKGLVKKIGVSIYSPAELDLMPANYQIDLVQAPLNLMDQELITSGWLRRLKEAGVEVHTRSAFLQGLLLMPRSSIPVKFSLWNSLWDTWYAWQDKHGISALEASLAFPLSIKDVDRVVVGADSAQQLNQIIEASRACMPENFPALRTSDARLINPSLWGSL